MKFYAGGDYRSAIREFSAAEGLAHADLNNYNLALCYDKLGDAEQAIDKYRAFLDKVPATDKRAEIEASIARLDAAAKSVAAKKAEEAKRAEEAKKAEDARIAAEAAAKAEEQRKADEARAAAAAAEARKQGPAEQAPDPRESPVAGGSTGTPSTGIVSTGDAQLDRAQSIDINSIRDARVGGQASGIPANDPRNPGAVAAVGPNGQVGAAENPPTNGMNASAMPPPNPNTASAGAPNGANPNGQPLPTDQPKKETPVYKKWWFWAVVAVSAYVVYQIATDDSSSSNSARLLPEVGNTNAQPGGMTLMRF